MVNDIVELSTQYFILFFIVYILICIYTIQNNDNFISKDKNIRSILLLFLSFVYALLIFYIFKKIQIQIRYKILFAFILTVLYIIVCTIIKTPYSMLKLYIKGIKYKEYSKPNYIVNPDLSSYQKNNLEIKELEEQDKNILNNLKKETKEYFDTLTDFEKDIIKMYQKESSEYRMINMFLNRNKNIPLFNYFVGFIYTNMQNFIYKYKNKFENMSELNQIFNVIGETFNKIILNTPPLKGKNNRVFRGTKDNYFIKKLQKINDEYIYISNSIVSTSFSESIAISFTNIENKNNICCLWIINLPENTNGLYLTNIGEKEYILPIGSMFKLKNIYNNDEPGKLKTYEWDYLPPTNKEYVERYNY